DAERVASAKGIKRIQFERPVQQKMKYARMDTGVDKIHQGMGLSQAYTGKGVVCGIVDQGFDMNHINFVDENGQPRVKYFETVAYNSNYRNPTDPIAIRTMYNTPDAIRGYKTDTEETYHATHTMGIMAGSYMGTTKAALLADTETKTAISDMPCPFYGVAFASDIVAANCSSYTDVLIAIAVEDLLGYAEAYNKPMVINLSLGTNQGSHDGKAVVCQFFDMIVDEMNAKIVMATGNEGDLKIAANKTLTADDNIFQTFITGDIYNTPEGDIYVRSGQVDIYGNDMKPFKSLQAIVWNTSRGRVAKRYSLEINEETLGTGKYWCSSSDYQEYDDDVIDATLAQYFSGTIGLYSEVDSLIGRSHCIVSFDLVDNADKNIDNNYKIGFIVEGEPGQRVDAFSVGYFHGMGDCGIEGFTDGSSNGSISDMACGKSTLSVGSYNTSEAWAQLDGSPYSQPDAGIELGKVSPFSSYGTLIDGRNLPDVVAPGAYIISSMNRYYMDALGYDDPTELLSGVATVGGKDYPYAWAAGTSMACPVVSGIIALWLEADPTLSIDGIRDIIKKTARMDADMLEADPVRVGAGKIDAYEGLKEVLRRKEESGVKGVNADDTRLLVSQSGERGVKVFLAGAKALRAEVFTMAGVKVMEQTTNGDETLLDLRGKNKGSYVIRVNGKQSKCILVK
ncbi:MAG: S8 family serine peptidase, partial [Prevotella sp.]